MISGNATVHVCESLTCGEPAIDAKTLEKILADASQPSVAQGDRILD
jgi:hypothetical protein